MTVVCVFYASILKVWMKLCSLQVPTAVLVVVGVGEGAISQDKSKMVEEKVNKYLTDLLQVTLKKHLYVVNMSVSNI